MYQNQEPASKTPISQAGASVDVQKTAPNIVKDTETTTSWDEDCVPVEQPAIKINLLHPDDFPKLPSPAAAPRKNTLHQEDESIKKQEPPFVWSSPHAGKAAQTLERGRGKDKPLDSTPLTRQGYRTGCLAEDFW